MTRIGISAHRDLCRGVPELIERAIRQALDGYDDPTLTGVSCLAANADRIFARAVLDRGGALEVVVADPGYRDRLNVAWRSDYDELVASASAVHHLNPADDAAGALKAASAHMLRHCHLLFAVWDGRPPRGDGGTADVVAYARNHGVPVEVIWPEGARHGCD